MANAFSTSIIHGYSKFQPAIFEPRNCSYNANETSLLTDGYTNTPPVIEYNGITFALSDVNRIQTENSNDKKFTVYTLNNSHGSLNKRPITLPYMYEQNDKEWTEDDLRQLTWYHRFNMIWKAYQCNNIFAVSIVPKNPSIEQTWYHKNLLTHTPLYGIYGSGIGNKVQFESNDGSELSHPEQRDIQGGFIKPFQTFQTNKIQPSLELEHLPQQVIVENLNNPEDVEDVVQEYYSEDTKPYTGSVLNSFLRDTEATHLGLLTLNPHQQLIFTKRT